MTCNADEMNNKIAKMIDDENNLVNHRITWVSIFNTLMFAGVSLVNKETVLQEILNNNFFLFFSFFSFFAIAINLSILISLFISEGNRKRLCKRLRKSLRQNQNDTEKQDPQDPCISRTRKIMNSLICGNLLERPCSLLLPWFIVPCSFTLLWAFVFLCCLFHIVSHGFNG